MQDVIKETVALLERHEPCVLATVVRTKGMTPQKAGARQLIRADGTSVGTLGGGCVEGDIWYYATRMLENEGGPEFRDYHLNADIAEKDGLVCGGTMYFYLEPLRRAQPFLDVAKEIVQAVEGGPAVALATVVGPQETPCLGNKLLLRQDGTTAGDLGDESRNERALRLAEKLLAAGGNCTFTDKSGVDVYVEGFTAPATLVILGGGHVGRAVYNVALTVGLRVIIIDDRAEFSNEERFPRAYQTVVAQFDRAFDAVNIGHNSFILVATRGHRYDDAATRAAVQTQARYIGLLGSKRKNILIFRELAKAGISRERIAEIHAPVGLDIGAVTPEEIAVSIIAEIINVQRGGHGGSMKMTKREIVEHLTD